MTKILVGYVLSPEGDAALEVGITEARLRGAELLVMHSSRGGDTEKAEDLVALDALAAQLRARLDTEGLPYRLGEQVLGNSPSTDIVTLATEEGVELVVIGVRRRSLVGKLILGSTAQEILMGAPCPVLAVKAPVTNGGGTTT